MSGSRRALVTGGAGFIGSHLVEGLVADGWRVRVLDDFSSGREENLADVRDRVDVVQADVCDLEAVAAAVAGVDAVFHLAAIPSVPQSIDQPLRADAVNVHATLGLLEASRRAGVARVVFAASCAVYGDAPQLPKREDLPPAPLSPYALHKLAGEHYCLLYTRLHALPTVALRYFNVYGPRQNPDGDYAAVIPRFLRDAQEGKPVRIFGDGAQTRDFVYVGDVVRANLSAVESERAVGRVLNVASGRETSVRDLATLVGELLGSGVAPVHEAQRPGDVLRSFADVAAAADRLGWTPQIDLREGLERTVASAGSSGADREGRIAG